MSRRRINGMILAGAAFLALAPCAPAAISGYLLFKDVGYTQTANTQPTTVSSFAAAWEVISNNPADLTGVRITSASPLSPMILTGANGVFQVVVNPTSKAVLDTDAPNGTSYLFTISGGTLGTQSAALSTPPSDAYANNIPTFLNNAFTGLQGVDPSNPIALTWNIWGPGTNVNQPLNTIQIIRASDGAVVYSTSGDNTFSSTTIPANTLAPNTQYFAELVFSARIIVANAGFQGATSAVAYDTATFLGFTPGAGTAPSSSCTYSLSASSASVGAAATTGSVQVTAPAGCTYTATAPAGSFASITGGASGSGSGTVTYSVQANAGNSRSTTLTIAGLPFTINQLGGCLFGLSPTSMSFPASGGTATFNLGASNSGCAFTAASNNTNFLIVGPTSGSGFGSAPIGYQVFPNSSSVGRTGTITAGGQTFTVVQAGTACSFALTQSSQKLSAAGGTGTASVQAPGGCTWTATSNSPFVTITGGASGSGNGTVTYTVQPNSASTQRTGTLTIAGLPYLVTESGAGAPSCTASTPTTMQTALEGRTEVVGDLIVSCTGLTTTVPADVLLTMNTNITNALASGFTDATLLVNGSTSTAGVSVGYNTLDFSGVNLAPASGGTATIRITNVRVDASLLGATASLQSVPITGTVTIGSAAPVPVANATQVMGYAAPTLVFQKGTAQAGSGGSTIIPLMFQEASPGAFHTAGTSPATRLRLVLSNVPAAIQVFSPVLPNEGNKSQLFTADATGAGGGPVAGGPGSYQQMAVVNGVSTSTWVVTSSDPNNFETNTFPMMFVGGTAQQMAQIQVSASLGPSSTVSTPSTTAPIPRFRDFSVSQSLVNLRATSKFTPAGTGSIIAGSLAAHGKLTSGLSPRVVGSNGTFTNQVTNDNQDTTATGVMVGSKVMGGGNITGCTTSVGSCTVSNDGTGATVNVGTLAPMAVVTVTVSFAAAACLVDSCGVTESLSTISDQPAADLNAGSSSSVFVTSNAPTWQVGVTHIGTFSAGQPIGFFTITVGNTQSLTATSGGPTVSVVSAVPVTLSGANWNCGASSCTRSDSLAGGATYPPITAAVNLTTFAGTSLASQVSVTGGGLAQGTAADIATVVPAFTDVLTTDSFLPAIDLLRESGITKGCGLTTYCGDLSITQGQMAVFVIRSVLGTDNFSFSPTSHFTDVDPSNQFFPFIQKEQELGIALSCGVNLFCPDSPVTRGQMAVLIIRARYGLASPPNFPTTPSFTDVLTTDPFFPFIQKMKQVGITTGCSGTTYCPNDPVTRGQMAVFIMRGMFNLVPSFPSVFPTLSATPAALLPGQTMTIRIEGQNTNFVSGSTQVTAGPGITVTNVTVLSATALTAQFAVAPNTFAGPRSIVAITGAEEATLPNGFLVSGPI